MIFTSIDFLIFFISISAIYWALPTKNTRNLLILLASYLFYGYVHPWFCYLLILSTIIDYFCARGIIQFPCQKSIFLIFSLVTNLGILCVFKYYDFFTENILYILNTCGLNITRPSFAIFLPAGISFYTFQTLSYSIDVYKGRIKPTKNFIDFAMFVSMFPQLVAGPIERATNLLPQIAKKQIWKSKNLSTASHLILIGFFKKLVIADNIAIYADQVFMLKSPSIPLLIVGSMAFALQIYADFSAYTDIARGAAKLLGFDLMKNFNAPYFAISPQDFWRRWHISFSSWIRDYLYIPLGGSKSSRLKFISTIAISMSLSGLWHGAEWHFVTWGIYHGILIIAYRTIGITGNWKPQTIATKTLAWAVMMSFTLFGWTIFRSNSLTWLHSTIKHNITDKCYSNDELIASSLIISYTIIYSLLMAFVNSPLIWHKKKRWIHPILYTFIIFCILIFARTEQNDFIYFRF